MRWAQRAGARKTVGRKSVSAFRHRSVHAAEGAGKKPPAFPPYKVDCCWYLRRVGCRLGDADLRGARIHLPCVKLEFEIFYTSQFYRNGVIG